MHFLKTSLAAVVILGAAAAEAGDIAVGGVVWDPDAPNDFTGKYDFAQWFTVAPGVADTNNAVPSLAATLDPSTLVPGTSSATLQGIGEFNLINAKGTNTTGVDNGPSSFCPTCELTFVFGGFDLKEPTPGGSDLFTNGWLRAYVDDTEDFLPIDGLTDPAAAADGALWLEARATNTAFTGLLESGLLQIDFDIVGGLAAPFFLENNAFIRWGVGIGDDAFSSTNAIFQNSDLDGNSVNEFYAFSNGTVLSSTEAIPVPAPLTLLGLGLVGLGYISSRRRSV